MEWKWTKGEPYERSRRIFKESEQIDNEKFNKEIEKSAYSTSLNHDEYTWDILNQNSSGNGFKVSNKREDLDLKIADRQLVQQIGGNPFLSDTNYVDDIATRDNFLKPVNTTQGRTKNTNNQNSNEQNNELNY
jgi:hypothetical protein